LTDIGRPDASEFAPYARSYIDLVEGNDVIEALTTQSAGTEILVREFDRASGPGYTYAPPKWTVNEVVCHIIDTERIFAYRALCVARGECTQLPGFDQDNYARASGANDRSLADLLEELRLVRLSTAALLAGLPGHAWDRRGEVNGHSVTVRGLAFHIAGHELHHVEILRTKYLDARHRARLQCRDEGFTTP
jgi:hypothetical protein